MLAEYRERLHEAREQAEEIVPARAGRPRPTSARPTSEAKRPRASSCSSRRARDIETETRRAIEEIRREVADLTCWRPRR